MRVVLCPVTALTCCGFDNTTRSSYSGHPRARLKLAPSNGPCSPLPHAYNLPLATIHAVSLPLLARTIQLYECRSHSSCVGPVNTQTAKTSYPRRCLRTVR